LTAVIVAEVPPVLASVTVRDAVVPTKTDPKSAELGLAETLGGFDPPPPEKGALPVVPHPVNSIVANTTATRTATPGRLCLVISVLASSGVGMS
jgi:hypothetical protein